MSVPSLLSIFGNSGSADPVYVDDIFSTFVYEGNGGTQSINNGIDLSGKGGLVWFKQRNGNTYGGLWDTVRGVTKRLRSDSNIGSPTVTNIVTSFNSNGVSISATGGTQINSNNDDYVSWTFRKQKGFFDVVTYTGNGTAGRTISHSLGSVPGMIMVKCTDESVSEPWAVYHRSLGNTKYLSLHETSAEQTSSARWNNTTPTSSVFTVGSDANVNQNTKTYVAYIFAHEDASFGTDGDESIIKCGSYTGIGDNGRSTIDIGFEPQWVLIKGAESNGTYWIILDNIRGAGDDGQDQPYISE